MHLERERPLDINEILLDAKNLRVGRLIRHFDSVGSTNDIAFRLANKGEEEGTVIVAEEQTAGKGRLNRSWSSAKYKGIYASIILRPELDALFVSRFMILASVSTARAIHEVSGIRAQIKWPNDILINERKAAGILAEGKIQERKVQFIVVGIGINVNHLERDFPSDVALNATSLLIESGRIASREKLLARLLSLMDSLYPMTEKKDFPFLLRQWKELSPSHENCTVRVKNGAMSYRGTTRGVTENGELIVEIDQGELITISYGDLITVSRDSNAARH